MEYLKLSKFRAFLYNLKLFFFAIPMWIWGGIKGIGQFFVKCGVGIWELIKQIALTFWKGNWAVKISFFIFGFGNFYYGQIGRGILFLLFEVIFFVYMFLPQGGLFWIDKLNLLQTGATVGTVQGGNVYNEILDTEIWTAGDDSTRVLLYGLLSVIFVVAFIYTWYVQFNQCRICMDITAKGKKVKSGKQDLRSLVDDGFHKTLLALPLGGIMFFTVLPIIYMVLIAFTNYSAEADGYSKLFKWVGLSNFAELLDFGKGGMGLAFRETLSWTLMWSFFATFSNYFLGMFVAIMINKKGIRIKKFWRTVLVMTIAIPQFVSLLYVGRMFDSDGFMGKGLTTMLSWIPEGFMEGAVGSWLTNLCPWLPDLIAGKGGLWDNATTARTMIIIINIWVGIPYIMLMATGILMNIPQDLYESSRIDGANTFQQYTKITLPYMLFVTGPYLLTSFVGNLNNFNVIYLLSSSGGIGTNLALGNAGGVSVGNADLLITWLYKMTLENATSKYYAASMIGILVFLVVAILSLVVYNVIPSTTNEEDFS